MRPVSAEPPSRGTKEAKRWRRAVPGAISNRIAEVGCFGVAAACLVLGGVAYWQTTDSVWLVLAVPAAIVGAITVLHLLYEVALLLSVRCRWKPRGVRCLVVYSNSPNWRDYIESVWLSRIGSRAATLNWSERASRPRTLEFRVFRHFLRNEMRNFSPAVVVFRGLLRPQVFRFFYAFRESRAGRPHYLHALEEQMFRALEDEDSR